MTFARDETNKVNDRVRIAHATSRRGIKRVRIAHDRTHAKLWPDGPGARPAASLGLPRRPPPHSRESGNPVALAKVTGSPPSRGRWNIEACFLVDAKWMAVPRNVGLRPCFPTYAGMTGWPWATGE